MKISEERSMYLQGLMAIGLALILTACGNDRADEQREQQQRMTDMIMSADSPAIKMSDLEQHNSAVAPSLDTSGHDTYRALNEAQSKASAEVERQRDKERLEQRERRMSDIELREAAK